MNKTAVEIALGFAEKFQANYPDKDHLPMMMDDLRKEIEAALDTAKSEALEAAVKTIEILPREILDSDDLPPKGPITPLILKSDAVAALQDLK